MGLLIKISRWYFSKDALPYWCVLVLDCACVFCAGLFGYYILNDGMSFTLNFWQLVLGLLAGMICYLGFFRAFHTYRGLLRFSSFSDLLNISLAVLCGSTLVFGLHLVEQAADWSSHIIFPNLTGAAIIFLIGTLLMWSLRVIVMECHGALINANRKNVFIYGAKSGGLAIARSIINTPGSPYTIAGIVTTNEHMAGSWAFDTKFYLDTDDLPKVMIKKSANILLVSPLQSERFRCRTTLIDGLIASGIKIMMFPAAEEWDGKSELSHKQLHEVEVEDLLPRQKIEVDMGAIGAMLKGKRILITGAAGSIGSEMSRQVAKFSPEDLILIDQAETPMHDLRLFMTEKHQDLSCHTIVSSITDQNHMEKIFSEYKPDYVFHAAAYKHVPMMEDNPGQAVRNNIHGTRVIADLAVKYGTKKFVMISTDKAVNPTNVMGCSKRICEIYCQALNFHQETTQFITTRFGNVLGSNGSVVPIFREQIKKGGPVKVTHPDIIRYFMLIPEACKLVLEAGTMGNGGEIFVFDMGEPVKIVDLAKRMIALSGATDVKIEFTGLRPGEKLYEELLATQENTKPTVHPKIMVAQVRDYPYEQAMKNEMALYELSKSFDDIVIVKKMKEIVPEFKSEISKYHVLDR